MRATPHVPGTVREMLRNDLARKIVLIAPILVFAGIAVASLVRPHFMAAGLGLRLDNVDALSEYRAIYVGLWLAHVMVLVVALRRLREPIFGDLVAVLILGQVVGRILSLAIDGMPAKVLPTFAAEAASGLAILLVRPAAPAQARAKTEQNPTR
jgi:hypothetical protein